MPYSFELVLLHGSLFYFFFLGCASYNNSLEGQCGYNHQLAKPFRGNNRQVLENEAGNLPRYLSFFFLFFFVCVPYLFFSFCINPTRIMCIFTSTGHYGNESLKKVLFLMSSFHGLHSRKKKKTFFSASLSLFFSFLRATVCFRARAH